MTEWTYSLFDFDFFQLICGHDCCLTLEKQKTKKKAHQEKTDAGASFVFFFDCDASTMWKRIIQSCPSFSQGANDH